MRRTAGVNKQQAPHGTSGEAGGKKHKVCQKEERRARHDTSLGNFWQVRRSCSWHATCWHILGMLLRAQEMDGDQKATGP